eukprot:TRINITY_DN3519_c0_g1_i1.p1 TRINITY_DN3519_c0_g1~~TRINITY_DN3519_c0_g1_i1.p1  ORF type:complete len:564 (-),score=146.12 TRINITY_DN3519_c0_g1_i1:71-1720(-)
MARVGGRAVALVVALVACVAAATHYGADVSVPTVPKGFRHGMNFGGVPDSNWDDSKLGTIAARSGCTSERKKLPEYHLDKWGYEIEVDDSKHDTQLGMLEFTGFLCGPSQAHSTAPNSNSLETYPPKNLYEPIFKNNQVNKDNYWASYVNQTVTIYKDYVKFWEVWNEPDYVTNWAVVDSWLTSPPSASDLVNWHSSIYTYIRLLRVTYEVVKKVDPTAFVAVGGIGYYQFLDAILRYTDNDNDGSVTSDYPATGGAWFDCLDFHLYPMYGVGNLTDGSSISGTDSDSMARKFACEKQNMEYTLRQHGYGASLPAKSYICTETGVSGKAIGSYAGGESLRRNYLIKMGLAAMSEGISQSHWFDLWDGESEGSSSSPYGHMGHYYNLVGKTVDNAELKESSYGLQTFTSLRLHEYTYDESATAAAQRALSLEGGSSSDVAVHVLRNGSSTAYALWLRTDRGVAVSDEDSDSKKVSLPVSTATIFYKWDWAHSGDSNHLTADDNGVVTVKISSIPAFLVGGGSADNASDGAGLATGAWVAVAAACTAALLL